MFPCLLKKYILKVVCLWKPTFKARKQEPFADDNSYFVVYLSSIEVVREPMARLVAFPTSPSVLLHPPLPFQFQ